MMMRLTSAIALFLTLLISSAHAQRDFDRDRDRSQLDRNRDRDRDRDRDRNRNRDLVLLGQQTVGFGVDRDVINIGQSEEWFRDRSFRSLRFVAERNDVYMTSVRLVYLNGYTENFRMERLIRKGENLPLDLGGEGGYLKQVEIISRSRPAFRGQGVIKVFGESPRRFGGPPGPPPVIDRSRDWAELGCQ